jgi:hypothetical protein
MATAQTAAYSGVTWKDQVYFQDGHQDLFYLGPPAFEASQTGYLAEYQNSDPTGIYVIDRIKITIDPTDSSENYLYFVLLRNDNSLVYSMAIPMSELIVGNPNFTNIKSGYKGQINFQCSIAGGLGLNPVLESVQYRVRHLDTMRTNI